jgi:hypothetical protein
VELISADMLIGHNLQLLTHGENVAKGFKDRKMNKEDKIKQIQQLYHQILNYIGVWQEHQKCLEFINNEVL